MTSIPIPARTPHIISVEKGKGCYRVVTKCPFCGKEHELVVSKVGFDLWNFKYGPLIQVVLPELNADQRELLINGLDDC